MAVRRLGKGLSALIPDIPSDEPQQSERLRDVEVSKVRPNPFQPRENFDPTALQELKQSISENGIIQPISVRVANSGYELIAGERRLRAVSELGLDRIPAYVMEVTTDEEMIELSLIENIQRENLNAVDEAKGYQTLVIKCNLTQDEVAKKVGKDRTTITNSLRILRLPKIIQDSLIKDEISAGHARALLTLTKKEDQINLWKQTLKKKYSVRQIENIVKAEKPAVVPRKKSLPKQDPFINEAENKLRGILGTQVRIKDNKGKGKIEIEYYSNSDIERILELMERI
ncbi:ParB/RepB/Spo0J family partition protein [candidate division KSB1 bacterium]|nr:ParB/RepB/Spo0J family partition protein [candidate division KSB1 bacterium]